MLAVGYNTLAPKEPVIVYDTADWHVPASFHLPDESRPGIGPMQFSDDGSVLVIPLVYNAMVANPRLSDIHDISRLLELRLLFKSRRKACCCFRGHFG